MKILLKGGTVVSGDEASLKDVLVEDEIIIGVGCDLSDENAKIVDVSGKFLFPGFIDAHTHFDLEAAGTITADDFNTGSRAALLGGTTTVIDFATQYRGESLNHAFAHWMNKAKDKASCDYGFHMAISDWNPGVAEEITDMLEMGVSSFKLYMTYDDMMVSDKQIYEVLKRLKELGGIAGVHCENSGLIKALVAEQKKLGNSGAACHPISRPAEVEAEAISRLCRIAELAEAPIIIVHLSSKLGYEEVLRARARGQKVYLETCTQYLLLDDERYKLPYPEGFKYIIAPPLRKKDDQSCLWEALAEGEIQTLSTDHCSFTLKQKLASEKDFSLVPGGMPGVQDRGVLVYSYGVKENKISLTQMCKLLSENPAKLYGAFPQKGSISEGADADIVVFDPEERGVISVKTQAYNMDYAPFEGFETCGRVNDVYLRGNKVVEDGRVIAEHGGRFLKRGGFNL
ncbi:MAG: dihydropyrimidinase [Clostridia bacterium]|nr:dihydropyrimidinase [Clostridia bacterium]